MPPGGKQTQSDFAKTRSDQVSHNAGTGSGGQKDGSNKYSKPSFSGAIQDGESATHQQSVGDADSLGNKEDSQFNSLQQTGQDVIHEQP